MEAGHHRGTPSRRAARSWSWFIQRSLLKKRPGLLSRGASLRR